MPNTPFLVEVEGAEPIRGTSDEASYATFEVDPLPALCKVSWGAICFAADDGAGGPAPTTFAFSQTVTLNADGDESPEAVHARLTNLGYSPFAELEDCVRAFQRDYGITPVNGDPNDPTTRATLFQHHDEMDLREETSPEADTIPGYPIRSLSEGG
jgi:hypothetical protein